MADKKVGNLVLGVSAKTVGFEGAIGGIAKLGLALQGIQTIAKAAIAPIKDLTEAFAKQQDADIKLATALKATGQYSEATFSKLKAYAGHLQKITTVGDETSEAAMQVGLNMGVSADKIEAATKGAIGLSKAFGIDLRSAMKYVSAGMQGNYSLLGRFLPQLQGLKDKSKGAAIFQRALASSFKVAEAETKTYAGSLEQMKNLIGDTKEKLGGLLAQALTPIFQKVSDWLGKNQDKIAFYMKVLQATFVRIGGGIQVLGLQFKLFWNSLRLGFAKMDNAVYQGISNLAVKIIDVLIKIAKVKDKIFHTDTAKELEYTKGQIQAFAEGSREAVKEIETQGEDYVKQIEKIKNATDKEIESLLKVQSIMSGKSGGKQNVGKNTKTTGKSWEQMRGTDFILNTPQIIEQATKATNNWQQALAGVAQQFVGIATSAESTKQKIDDMVKSLMNVLLNVGLTYLTSTNPALAPFAPAIQSGFGAILGTGAPTININNPLLADSVSYDRIASNVANSLKRHSIITEGVASV